MSKKYCLVYELGIAESLDEGFSHDYVTKKAKENRDIGACDALLLASVVRPEEGGLSVDFHYKDPKMQGKTDLELFKIWVLLGNSLRTRESNSLNKNHKFILEVVHGLLEKAMQDDKGKDEGACNGRKNEEII